MKICPNCQKTYSDETLNFCLECGTTLTVSAPKTDLPQTVFIPPANPTSPPSGFGNQPHSSGQNQGFGNQPPQFGTPNQSQGNWGNPQQPQFSMVTPQIQSPPKSSKTWIWVLGILGVVAVLCGGSFLALIVVNNSGNSGYTPNNSTGKTSTPTVSPTPKDLVKFDMSRWKTGSDEYADTSYSNGVVTVEVTKANYYYVLLTDVKTQDKITKVTVKNTGSNSTNVGFGLIVHSYSTPLIGDYAFLIDTDQKRYRIVEHLLKNEKDLKDWKNSSAIKGGSSENILEVRDSGDKMEFYINGELVTTVDDKYDNQAGVAGIYACDGLKIEFSNLTTESK